MKIDYFGKPHASAFEYARRELEEMYGTVEKVVMVGDNVESDIAGVKELGWDSILVKTGVAKEDYDKATVNAENIWEGISQYLE